MASVDAAWLGMEDPTNLMMVTGVMVLDAPVDIGRMRLVLDRRLAGGVMLGVATDRQV